MQDEDILAARDKRLRLMRALSDDLCTVSDRGRLRAEALVIAAAESLSTPAKREQQGALQGNRSAHSAE